MIILIAATTFNDQDIFWVVNVFRDIWYDDMSYLSYIILHRLS